LEFLQKEFTRLGLEFVPSQANFILVRVGKGQEVFQQLLRQGVIVRPTAGYRFPEHVRVTIGTMEGNRKFIDALEKVIRAI
jgi:histidinol-phosphate aminotransferase